ncbi:JAB domain-containing protein [Colwellia psychrerythraea]|uniref:RadC-like JAB domain containing protein n=1 Tax=Colwellia psychrerythraea TaxID=28229 RepID=A0A099KME7_COLPS|nr:JAB domain-containing protein [Colwellia psychrerythraea]KGJ90828.1 RadC-like JAB domain containing protein [Colwellia psychrerythraea]
MKRNVEQVLLIQSSGYSFTAQFIDKEQLLSDGAAVFFVHNHPSDEAKASQADITITKFLKEALALINVQVLDHIVVGDSATLFA